jgi:hypothetical protein
MISFSLSSSYRYRPCNFDGFSFTNRFVILELSAIKSEADDDNAEARHGHLSIGVGPVTLARSLAAKECRNGFKK